MGFISDISSVLLRNRRSRQISPGQPSDEAPPSRRIDAPAVVVGASNANDEKQIQSFDNSNITFSGELSGYDYGSILRDKQRNIISLYQ